MYSIFRTKVLDDSRLFVSNSMTNNLEYIVKLPASTDIEQDRVAKQKLIVVWRIWDDIELWSSIGDH